MKAQSKLILFLCFVVSLGCSFSQDQQLSDTTTNSPTKWLDNIRADISLIPGSQRELVNIISPLGKTIEQKKVINFLLVGGGINYRNNFFVAGIETLGANFNGVSVGGNLLFWEFNTPEIDLFASFKYGVTRKSRFDITSTDYMGIGFDFYLKNIHLGFTNVIRQFDENNEPNLIKRANVFLILGYSFNRKTFKN